MHLYSEIYLAYSLIIYLTYILAVYLAYILAFYLAYPAFYLAYPAFYLGYILAVYLTYTHMLSDIYSDILAYGWSWQGGTQHGAIGNCTVKLHKCNNMILLPQLVFFLCV